MENAERLALAFAQEADAGEGRVGLEVARRGQQAERPACGFLGLDGIGLPIGHRRQTLLGQLLGVEFELARRRLEGLAVPVVLDVERHAREQLVAVDLRGRARRALEELFGGLSRRQAEDRVGDAHALRQRLRDMEVRTGLARRFDRLLAPLHPVGAVGAVEIVGLEIVRGRQHDVGVARGVGHERVVHDGEQVLAHQTLLHLVDLGAGHDRIVGRHEQRAEGRVLHVEELFAEAQVIDHARRRGPGGLAHRRIVEVARGGRQQQRAAALDAVMAGHARQQRHGAQGLAAMGEAGHAFAEADQRGLGVAVQGRELLDVGDGEAGDLGRARRRELRQHLALDLVEAQRVNVDVVEVGETVAHQDVHDAERQGGVGADPDGQVEVGGAGAARAARVDHDDRHAGLLALALGQGPEMHVGGSQVGAPRDHQVGIDDRFGIGAAHRADRHFPGGLAARVADRTGLKA